MRIKLPALYELADEYRVLADRLADLDLDEQTVADTLEGAAGELETKAREMAKMIRNWESLADQLSNEAASFRDRAVAYKNRAARVTDYLKAQLERAGKTKIDGPGPVLTIKKNPWATIIDDPALVPDEYKRIPDMPMPAPDKAEIKRAIDKGVEVPGAHLSQTTRLEIK